MNDHFITLEAAVEMTERYRAEKENILAPEFRGKDILLLAETFDRGAIEFLLTEPGCVFFRVYFGMTKNLQVRAIMVGVDENDQDILPAPGEQGAAESTPPPGNGIVEQGNPCPTSCPPRSPLNGG